MGEAMIPFWQPQVGDYEQAIVQRVLESNYLNEGEVTACFENTLASLLGCKHVIATTSGTVAIFLALKALGIGHGDEVIVPSFSFAATANSVALAGATPIFADIDPKTFNMDPDHVETLITKKTKAIMPVHLYGHIAAMDRYQEISSKYGIKIIEDAAQGHLASLNGRNAGEFGVVATFSFYPTKNMTAGEGGMVVTDDAEVARMLRLLRNQGQEIRYQNEVVGFNTRMTDIHAAIGRVQLRKLPGWTKQRQDNAAYLDANIKGVVVPFVQPGSTHSYHQYTVRVPGGSSEKRDAFMKGLADRGVGSGVYYPTPIHRLKSFNLTLDLPQTELLAKECVSLPVHPSLTQDELKTIVSAVNEVAASL
jgi:dTDP-4-amino-4,6-dideoxygalactose transaminase